MHRTRWMVGVVGMVGVLVNVRHSGQVASAVLLCTWTALRRTRLRRTRSTRSILRQSATLSRLVIHNFILYFPLYNLQTFNSTNACPCSHSALEWNRFAASVLPLGLWLLLHRTLVTNLHHDHIGLLASFHWKLLYTGYLSACRLLWFFQLERRQWFTFTKNNVVVVSPIVYRSGISGEIMKSVYEISLLLWCQFILVIL